MSKRMRHMVALALLAPCLTLLGTGRARAQDGGADTGQGDRLDSLQLRLDQQTVQLEDLRSQLQVQEHSVAELRQTLADERLAGARARGVVGTTQDAERPNATGASVASADNARSAQDPERRPQPVGRAPEQDLRPPEVAQIFEQPGVLTPPGKFVLEPSLQYGYSSSNRVALVGYTVIPAILIGLIDVRQVKTTTGTATMTARYGLSNRLELEARVPYVYTSAGTVSREIFTGSALDKVFNAHGEGIGDVEATVRYQLNRGGPDKAFYVGWLRYKSNTGKDPFEVVTDCVTRCVANATGTGLPLQLPTGSGFQSIQPGLTWLYPSDPVVFFGSFSYLHNFARHDVSRTVLTGAPEGYPQTATDPIGDVDAGDIWGFNVGMGLALNEKASISIGYDTSLVGKTQQNGADAPGAVRVTLGTLLLGASYRYSERYTLNVSLGVGVTRDTPDATLTARVPMTF
ncbi:acetate kinase [Lysobacter ciconiae]|uniref:Acetate kinase n=1 Tax=Novilysobacter ciconiae TaxID=2781022 RepID=A0A7S6ZR80_9GAMM|nr:acetate kinase [Lysobacter ciconiae]QOW18425.1 acetate kinase [Lysobacter ciconiae]